MKLEIDTSKLPSDAQLRAMFDAVPILERHQVADKTVRAGAKPVVTRARQLSPRSSKTGSAKKRSKAQQASADWNTPLYKTIKQVVRKYSANAFAVVGPKWPEGNKAYFNTSPGGRKQVLWGKPTGKTIAAIRNWIVQAFDETKPQQLSAMKTKLRALMDEVWSRG